MRTSLIIISIIQFLFLGCSSSEAQSELKVSIKEIEREIMVLSQNGGDVTIAQKALIDSLSRFVDLYDSDPYAPICLDKIHMIHTAKGNYQHAVVIGDMLLDNYPDYANRAMILESQATAYDVFIQPRDTDKITRYYKQLLEEFPDLPKEKKQNIQDRLDNIHLTVEEMILKNN